LEHKQEHIPVMLRQCMEMLNVTAGKVYVDATAGAGGHLREIAALCRTNAGGKVIGIDQDHATVTALRKNLSAGGITNAEIIQANFRDLRKVLLDLNIDTINGGILADLGVSSMQLGNAERGFSFIKSGPLDMRMDSHGATTAADLVNDLPEKDLADIIYKYGEERLSRQIARKIVEARPLKTTGELALVVSRVVGPRHGKGKHPWRDDSHPATRTFQALRNAAIDVLAPGARLVVISFHSLEDRLVKQILKGAAASCICPPRQPICTCLKRRTMKILTSRPLIADAEEVLANPRSRSAKLRAGEKERS
jgi:16S rRNA (cytosine1402-N4)-methyltransferase